MTHVELIYDTDCPNVQRARMALLGGFSLAGLQPSWTEWDRKSPDSPAYARRYGSPTILVNRRDVAGAAPGDGGSNCRLYRNGSGALGGAPSAQQVAEILGDGHAQPPIPTRSSSGWRSSLATIPGIAFAFLPKLVCPACWPAYAGLLSSVGLGFLLNTAYLFQLTVAFLVLAVGALAFRARTRRGYAPFALGLAAATVVVVGKFVFDSNAAMYGGIGLLVGASMWNACPKSNSNVGSCPKCVQQELSTENKQRTLTEVDMATKSKRKIEVFSAGCPACEETVQLVNRIACPSCDVSVLDMNDSAVAKRAKSLGVRSVPAVVIDGELADCCAGRGPEEAALRTAGVGQPI